MDVLDAWKEGLQVKPTRRERLLRWAGDLAQIPG